MAGNGEVLEGFICPICMTDFKAPNHLTKHFEEVHNDDPEILKSLKGERDSFRFFLFFFSYYFVKEQMDKVVPQVDAKWISQGLRVADLFGKAKKKILKQDDIPETFQSSVPQDKRRSPEINWGPQEIGANIFYIICE